MGSPRKSSTSSGRTEPLRPRYLGIEAAGSRIPPRTNPGWWQVALSSHRPPATGPPPFRVVRFDGIRAIVRVGHLAVDDARASWNDDVVLPDGSSVRLRTVRSWGTLVGAKEWLGSSTTRRGESRSAGGGRSDR